MRIAQVDLAERVLIVAEIGNNHEGDVGVARELVAHAAAAGADAVKLQTFVTEELIARDDAARFARLESFRLPASAWPELSALARSLGLAFLSTPLDLASAELLAPLVDAVKIASGDLDFMPLLDLVAAGDRPIVLSTGASRLDEVERSVARVTGARAARAAPPDLALLHCVSAYPAEPAAANLRAIALLAERFAIPVGWSDHTIGIEAAVIAVAAGARIVEKHVTLAHDYSDFRDHQLSADPRELAELVRRVRAAETLLGGAVKAVQAGESPEAIRRFIVSRRALAAGHRLALGDLAWLRPAGGLRPGDEERMTGRLLRRALGAGERLSEGDVE